MKKNYLDVVSAMQKGLVSQVYPETKLKVFSPERHMQEGETLTGELTMIEDNESFEFCAREKESWKRNPTVFNGEYINVHRDKQGHYQVTLRRLEMKKGFNAIRTADAIKTELLTAKKILGL